ncbi:MAG: TIGR04141 family sporadically distributed protein [Lachnospiraceae bacterium]|nr:TIGR04141 family sporadically distributed protein [Lachnospiraceae bacterium]
MASINLYKIDPNKVQLCLQDLAASRLVLINTLEYTKIIHEVEYNFGATLYLEEPHQSDDGISWNWLLNEFEKPTYQSFRAPKAVLLIEETVGEAEVTYAITFGSSYFRIDKFCDKDFGFKFASRMEYTNVKTTTLTAPNLNRSKTVNTYMNYSELDFNSGESFSKLKVNAKIGEDFTLFKAAIEIGNSIRFNIDNETIDGILEVIIYVEKILMIPDENARYKIPLFQLVKDEALLITLNQNINQVITETLLGKQDTQLFSLPELEIIGANEIFNYTDDVFELKYPRANAKKITNLTVEIIRSFCQENTIDSMKKIDKIGLVRYRDGESVATLQLKSIIEYTDDENKCIFSSGKWYMFNHDYLTYLNDSVKEIKAMYKAEYDFNDTIHNQFVDSKYEIEKDEEKYIGKSEENIKESLKRKYYAERCFNLLREEEGSFSNYDRVGTSVGFEKMDLYEIDTSTMFAVKKGKASSDLCYAVDQSLTALKKYKHGEIPDMPPISNVGLWFIFEKAEHLLTDTQNKVDLSSLDMLMLKNRIDQWKKEVRLAGYNPIIYINYRL